VQELVTQQRSGHRDERDAEATPTEAQHTDRDQAGDEPDEVEAHGHQVTIISCSAGSRSEPPGLPGSAAHGD
jgi:hypothetical protein